MIQGFFLLQSGTSRPFVRASLEFPGPSRPVEVLLLVDTGADRTILAPADAARIEQELGISFASLASGQPSTGVGGQMSTRRVDVVLMLGPYATPLTLTILEPPPTSPLPLIPSLLGRDILSRFALFVEQRTNRVLLLDPHEADALLLPQ